jgi:Xaa-Pro aminopeptidase
MTHDRYAQRRAEFMERLGDTIAIVPAGNEQTRNDDVDHAFRQNSDFFFLTGFPEPDGIAVFDPSHDTDTYVLFVRPRDPEMESWNGRRVGTTGAMEQYNADAAHAISEFPDWIRTRLSDRTDVAFTLGGPHQAAVLAAMAAARNHGVRLGIVTPDRLVDPRTILHEMRVVKSSDEIAALRRACHISAVAHAEAMRFTEPGMCERQVQAVIEYVFSAMGSDRIGYGSIVAGGENAVILHYVENDQTLTDGDLLLIDAGAEYRHLTADITRTFPVNGSFTSPQRAIYDIVLKAERSVIDRCAPGLPFSDMHPYAVGVLTEGMVDLGLLPDATEDAIAKGWYREFFFHGTGHWLGVDVHDAGAYRIDGRGRTLLPGMAFTVEPGVYIAPEKGTITLSHALYDPDEVLRMTYELGATKAKEEMARRREEAGTFEFEVPGEFLGIGVRIEDDILITEDGHENMSTLVPTDPVDIEALCAEESSLPQFA